MWGFILFLRLLGGEGRSKWDEFWEWFWLIALVLIITLGVWKSIELTQWLWAHVYIGVK